MSFIHINNSIPNFIAISKMKNTTFDHDHGNGEEFSRNNFCNISKYMHESKTPKVLIMSLEAMYKTIQDTYESNPIVCCKFLQSILTYLESLHPGDWISECDDIIDYLFKLLLGIVQTIDMQTSRVINRSRSMTNSICNSVKKSSTTTLPHCLDDCLESFDCHISVQKKLCNIATACLFSIGIVKANISMLLVAVNTVLIRNGLVDDNDTIQAPSLVLKLKNMSDLVTNCNNGNSEDIVSCGQFSMINPLPENVNSGFLVSNGTYLYWLTSVGLMKIGTGFNGSIKGFVYLTNEELAKYHNNWMGFVSSSILIQISTTASANTLSCNWRIGEIITFYKINIENLQIDGQVNLKMTTFRGCSNSLGWKYHLFSNALRVGFCLINEDNSNCEQLFIRIYKLTSDKFLVEESETSIDLTQHLVLKIEADQSKTYSKSSFLIETSSNLSLSCEAFNLEEFCVIRNQSGEVFYKDLENLERNNNVESWSRLYYNDYIPAKFNKLIGGIESKFICAISDDGLWRITVNKHSQPRGLSLDRLMSNSRFLSKTWISGSCSKDNLALVSKEGQVLFLEKNSIHSLSTCYGALLSPYHVTQISMGKSHGACLSRNGYLITFGVNNYNQCGFTMGENDAKYNEMIQEIDNNNLDNGSQLRSKHQVKTIKPQKLLIYSDSNISGGLKNQSNFLRIQQVSCGYYHTILLTVTGDVYSFGNNKFNQLGRGFLSMKELPKAIQLQTKAIRITTGPFSTAILVQTGKVMIFGSKLTSPVIIDFVSNPCGLTDNLQPIYFNLSTNIYKKQIIFCILKQNIFYMKKRPLTLSTVKHKPNQQEKFRFFVKENNILLVSKDQRCLFIDNTSGTIRMTPETEQFCHNISMNSCFDHRYSVIWSIDQIHETKKFIISYHKGNYFKSNCFTSKIDQLIDLSDTHSFFSQRYRIALNVLVNAEKLLLRKLPDPQASIDVKAKHSNKDIFTLKRFTKENSNWLYSLNAHDSIKFSVSESIYLYGVGLYSGSGENSMSLKIFEEVGHDSDDEMLNTNLFNYDNQFSSLLLLNESEKIDTQTTENRKIIQAMLPAPIILFPNKFYVIIATITGDSTDFGFHGRSKLETDLGITFKFKQSKHSSNGTQVKEGQIPEIYYSPKIPEPSRINFDIPKSVLSINATNMTDYLTGQMSMSSLTSAVALLNWIYTGLTCMFSELPDLHSGPNCNVYPFKLLKSLETLKLYSRAFTSTLKIIRKHIQYLYPYNGSSKECESHETSVVIGDFRIIVRNIFLECKICHYLQLIKTTYGANSLIFLECWRLYTEDLIPVYKETFESSFHAFYPEIEDQRFTLQEALTKVYEYCFSKPTDTLCNHGKIIFLSSLLTAINGINNGSVLLIQRETSLTHSGVDNKIEIGNHFSDRFPLLREYMRTIWKPNSSGSSDMLSSTATMIHCLLSILTVDVKKAYRPCKQTSLQTPSDNDTEERKIFDSEMTNLIHASHLILTNITLLVVDQLNPSAKSSHFHMTNSTNSKNNGQNPTQPSFDDIILTTQSRFKKVIWTDKINDSSEPKVAEHQIATITEQEMEDAICFSISKDTNQFINGYEVVGENIIYLEGIKVYCSNFSESRCSAYIYQMKNFPSGIKENWQLIPMECEWKNEEHDLIASDLIFKRKLKLEETYRYAIKVFLTTSNIKKVLVGQQPVMKLDARFGYRFNLYETKLNTGTTENWKQGIIFSLMYSFSNRPISVMDNQRLERKMFKMCLTELLVQVKHTLVSVVKETNPEENVSIGPFTFIESFVPFFCNKLQSASNVSKKITCLLITMVRETLPVIHEHWKSNDKTCSQEKDFLSIIESSHPYEAAKLLQNTIKFPDSVQAISISFDNRCITSQPEDYLMVKVRSNRGDSNSSENNWKLIFKSLSNIQSEWPKKPIIIPGNEITIEFHTASLYEDSLESTYGFKCTIVGHCSKTNASIEFVENSLTYLATKCAVSLLEYRNKSKIVKLLHETNILSKCDVYRHLLDQGMFISRLPTLTDCLNKAPLEYVNSIQTTFIKKFVGDSNSSSDSTSPATRLAKWLQSSSVVVVNNCKLKMMPSTVSLQYLEGINTPDTNIVGNHISCELNKEVCLQLELVDQYENRVSCQMCSVDVILNYHHKGNNPFIDINEKIFGGHPVPNTTVPFEKTILGKDVYQSITMMKNYEMYSFDEIRAAGLQENVCKSQNIKSRWSEDDGCFYIDWIAKICGQFHLIISIDKIILKSNKTVENITLKIDVTTKLSNYNLPTEKSRKKAENVKDKSDKPKYLWFEGNQSSGLRIRSQPLLNSPVLGIIPCNTVVRYEEELFTENSVWVRLQIDSFHQWYGYYPTDPLDQRPIISVEPPFSNQETLQMRRKAMTSNKPQIKSTGFNEKKVKSNLKPFNEGWCLKEHMNRVFLTPAKLNFNTEVVQKENIFKIFIDNNSQVNNAPFIVLSKTLPSKRRSSARSNQTEFSKYASNTIAVSLPNSPELTSKRTHNKLAISNGTSSSQPTSPGTLRRKPNKASSSGPKNQTIGKALSPLQAAAQRALFAAILWQNGLVSDFIQISESINLYSSPAYHQQLEKHQHNSNCCNMEENRNINPILFDHIPALSTAITRSNSQNTADLSLLSDSGGMKPLPYITTVPRIIPSLADLVANAVAATSNSMSNEHSPTSNKSIPRPTSSIKRSQSHMEGKIIQTVQTGSKYYRQRFYSQVKEEETRKLGLHVSLDEEFLDIGKPSSSSNCKLNDNLQSEMASKLNQMTKLWDTISAILVLSEQQNQINKGQNFNEPIQMSSGTNIYEEMCHTKQISNNFYQKVYDNSLLLLEIEPKTNSFMSKQDLSIIPRDQNMNSKIIETNRLLSPNNDDGDLIHHRGKYKMNSAESCFLGPNSSKYFPESDIDISKSTKPKFNNPNVIYAHYWPLHNLQKANPFSNHIVPEDISEHMNTGTGCEDSSIYLKCDCWSCLPILKESSHRQKTTYSSGNITENSIPNSVMGTAFTSSGIKQHLLKLNKTANSSWEHTVTTSSESNSTSIRQPIGSCTCCKSYSAIDQLLQSMMSLLVNIVASSSSGMEIFDRSMTGSNLCKKDCSNKGMVEMRFCLCYSQITELRLALETSLRIFSIEQYSYQIYFWLMDNVKTNSSMQIVVWCLYNLLQQQKYLTKSKRFHIKLIEEKRIKVCCQQLWAVGSSVFYRIMDNMIHSCNLDSLTVSEIKLLEMIVKLSSLLLFADESDKSCTQSFINFEKSQVFSCLSELLNHLDDHKAVYNKLNPNGNANNSILIKSLIDITPLFSCHVSSNSESAASLFDNNTDIFWESSGSNIDPYPSILLKLNQKCKSSLSSDHIMVAIYIDRTRDVINGQVTAIARMLKMSTYQQVTVDPDHIGWICFHLENKSTEIQNGINIGFHVLPDEDIHTSAANGAQNDKIRVRCVKVFDASETVNTVHVTEDDQMRQRYELLKEETLKSFIEMTNYIFYNCFTTSYQSKLEKKDIQETMDIETKSLHDFLVNILFDTGFKSEMIASRLSSLQRRVLSHIITQINFEVTKMLIDRQDGSIHIDKESSDKQETFFKKYDPIKCSCCFQLLNQVLALSGAQAGLRYLIHQAQLIRDLIILLYVGSDKIRQQVMFAITRIFSAVSPRSLEDILYGVLQPPEDETVLPKKMKLEKSYLPLNLLILFAGKSLNIQIKSKTNLLQHSKPFGEFLNRIVNLPKFIQAAYCDPNSANKVYQLIYQLSDENNHTAWYVYIQEWLRDIFESFVCTNQTSDPINWDVPNLYLLICLLPLLENTKLANFWNNLSLTARVLKSGDKKMCTNHDDDSTVATTICYTCQPLLTAPESSDTSTLTGRLIFLCAECDRYLHLSKMTKYHIRDNLTVQTYSTASVASGSTAAAAVTSTDHQFSSLCDCIVSSQENCVRLKSNKFIVTVDISTLKILINLIQFPTNTAIDFGVNNVDISSVRKTDQEGQCRFCNGQLLSTNISDTKLVCLNPDCQIKASVACFDKLSPCGHLCLGVVVTTVAAPHHHGGQNEGKQQKICPPVCIAPTCSNQSVLSKYGLKQDGDDVCMICFTDTLFEGPIIILDNCRHMLHYHCVRRQLQAGWPGYRVTFNFRKCPFCKQKMEHPALQDLLGPYDILEKEVKRKALLRLEHEGLIDSSELKNIDGSLKEQPEEFALNKYCYYLCYKCKNCYYGGEARCEPDIGMNVQGNIDKISNLPALDPATELCCAACSDVAQAKVCPKHSTDFLEYKCRYCCSVAVFFCFGTTHFCQRCHDNLDTVLKATWLPQCPAGPALQHLSTTECPLHVIHPPTGEEFALGCALCRKLDTF